MIKIPVKPQPGKGPGINIYGKHVTESVHQIFSRFMRSQYYTCEYYKARQKCNAFFQGGFDAPDGEWVFIEFWGSDWTEFRTLLKRRLNLLDNDGKPLEITVKFDPLSTKAVEAADGIHNFMEGWYQPDRRDEGLMTYIPKDGADALYVIEMIEHHKDLLVWRRTDIKLDPYEWAEKGILDLVEMIEDETQVPYIWLPGDELRFMPTNDEEKYKVMDLLQLFKVPFVNEKFGY